MPGKKQYKDQADVDMMRAAYDSQADMELGAGVLINISLSRTRQRGVYELRVTASGNPKVWAKSTTETYAVTFPSSQVVTLAGQLFRAMTALDRQLGEAIAGEGWEAVEGLWNG